MLTVRRAVLFLVGCIGVRVAIVVAAAMIPLQYLPYMGLIALLPVIGWTYILITDGRRTGLEVGGGQIWWNSLRPIHALNYTAFAATALMKNRNAYLFLLWDVILGLGAWINHHFM